MEPEKKYEHFTVPPEGFSQIEWFLKYVDSGFTEIRSAVSKSEETHKEYRSMANEWRGSLNDLTQTFARKDLVEALTKGNEDAKNELKRSFDLLINEIKKTFEIQITALEKNHDERIKKMELENVKREGKLWTLGVMWVILVALVGWYISTR